MVTLNQIHHTRSQRGRFLTVKHFDGSLAPHLSPLVQHVQNTEGVPCRQSIQTTVFGPWQRNQQHFPIPTIARNAPDQNQRRDRSRPRDDSADGHHQSSSPQHHHDRDDRNSEHSSRSRQRRHQYQRPLSAWYESMSDSEWDNPVSHRRHNGLAQENLMNTLSHEGPTNNNHPGQSRSNPVVFPDTDENQPTIRPISTDRRRLYQLDMDESRSLDLYRRRLSAVTAQWIPL
eukprot:gene6853-13883_t